LLAWDGTNDAGFVVPDGVYTVALQAILARNPAVTQQENVTVSVDVTPPSIGLTRPASGVVTATGQVQGSITDQHLNTYTVSLTETPLGPQTRLLSSGTSNAVTAHLGSLQGLQEGRYTLKVEARDAGENSATTQVVFVVDNTPPVVDLTAPAPGSVLGRKQNPVVVKGVITETHVARYQLNVSAGAEPSAWVSLANSTQPPGTDVLGTWNIASLADGLYTLQVLVDDQAGLRAEKRLQLTIDNTPPIAALSTPGDGSYVSVPLMITGSATDTHLVSYRLEITSTTASTQWSPIGSGVSTVQNGLLLQWPSLPPDGAYLLRLTAVDRAGNSAETIRRITVDTTPPGAPAGLRASIVNRQVHLAWQASPATDLTGYTVSRDGQRLTPTLLTVPEYMDTTVSEGRYVYTVAASDQAGLTSAPSAAVTITVDFTPPQVKIFGPVPGATVSGVVDIRGTAYSKDDFKVYRVSVGAGVSPTVWQLLRQSSAPAQADILMQWNTLGLSEGAHYGLKLEAEDINGNVSSEQISVTIDNQAPAPPTGLIARRGSAARPFYERALAVDPAMKEALLGAAYLDLEDGDTAKALDRLNVLKNSDPADPEVVALEKQILRARAPWVQIGWDGSADSDDNAMNIYRAEGGFSIPAHMDLRFGHAHSDLHGAAFDNTVLPPVLVNPDANASADTLYGVLGWQPKARHRGELRLGAMTLSDSSGGERTTGIGGLSYTFPMASWTGRAAVARDPFLYSPEILRNEIDVTSVTFGASGLAAPRVQVETNGGYGDFSDGNGRWNADAGAWYVWKWPKRTLMAGGAVRYLGFTNGDNVDNGYFDPSHLIAALLSMRSSGAIGSSKWEYETAVEAGAQSYTFNGDDATGNPLWSLYGLVVRPLPHGLSFQIFAGFSNSSTASGPGFTSRSGGVRLRWTIGG
jgi:hypothetical protein